MHGDGKVVLESRLDLWLCDMSDLRSGRDYTATRMEMGLGFFFSGRANWPTRI